MYTRRNKIVIFIYGPTHAQTAQYSNRQTQAEMALFPLSTHMDSGLFFPYIGLVNRLLSLLHENFQERNPLSARA